MIEILKYSTSGFCVFIGCFLIITTFTYFGVNGTIRIFTRFLRTLNILFRGWPPSHLDADGDFHKNEDNETDG